MCALQKQYDFFKRNMSSLLEDYKGKFLIISDSLEVKAFDTISEAYKYGTKTFGLGNFMLQECNDDADKIHIISNLGLA